MTEAEAGVLGGQTVASLMIVLLIPSSEGNTSSPNCHTLGYSRSFLSADGKERLCSLPVVWRPNYGRNNGDLLQKDLQQNAASPRTAAARASDSTAGHC